VRFVCQNSGHQDSENGGKIRGIGTWVLREVWVADFGGWVMGFAWFCLVLLGFLRLVLGLVVRVLGSLLSNHSFLI